MHLLGKATYLVECFWPDVRPEQVEEAADRLKRSTQELGLRGQRVDYTGSIFVPTDEVIFYLFEGFSAEAVRTACEQAGLRFERVLRSVLSKGMQPRELESKYVSPQ